MLTSDSRPATTDLGGRGSLSDPVFVREVGDPMKVVQPKPYVVAIRSDRAGSLHEHRYRAVGVVASRLLRLHFAEMWVTMLLGSAAFEYVRHGLAIVGGQSFLDPKSIQSAFGQGFFMTAPMMLWMRIRGYRWRENIEMALLGMIVPWATVLALDRFGELQGLPCCRNETQWPLQC